MQDFLQPCIIAQPNLNPDIIAKQVKNYRPSSQNGGKAFSGLC